MEEQENQQDKASPVEAVVRHELIHAYPGYKLQEFMQDIDDTGGWPVGYTHVSFFHAVENSGRYCQFTMRSINTGWWTTVCTADDYYYWKLSETKRAEVLKLARQQLIQKLW